VSDHSIRGIIKNTQGNPIKNIMIQAMDSDQKWYEDRNDDILGSTWSKEDGTFEIPFNKEKFKDSLLENNPQVFLIIRNSFGQIIHTTESKTDVEDSNSKGQNDLSFEISLASIEKDSAEISLDPYLDNNQRVISAFQKLGDVTEFQLTDVSRILRLLNTSINAWSMYTTEYTWDKIGYDGPQVPKFPWRIHDHSHKLSWEEGTK
jgi:hypothetical protein